MAVNVIVPVSLPEAGPRVNHAAVAVAFQFNVPWPMFVTVKVCVVELPSPRRALKEKLGELTPITGFGNDGDGIGIGCGAASGVNAGISDMSLPAANADCINGTIGSQTKKSMFIATERNNNRWIIWHIVRVLHFQDLATCRFCPRLGGNEQFRCLLRMEERC